MESANPTAEKTRESASAAVGMSRKFSKPRADGILAEPKAAREDLCRFIADEKIDCDFAMTGRFSGASAPGDYDTLARDAEALLRTFGIEA